MEELKKCPCCGGEPKYYQFSTKRVIYCTGCGLKIERDYGNRNDIINDWNKRMNKE